MNFSVLDLSRSHIVTYRKIPNISPGLIDILNTFLGLIFRGLIFVGLIFGGHFVSVSKFSRLLNLFSYH